MMSLHQSNSRSRPAKIKSDGQDFQEFKKFKALVCDKGQEKV